MVHIIPTWQNRWQITIYMYIMSASVPSVNPLGGPQETLGILTSHPGGYDNGVQTQG